VACGISCLARYNVTASALVNASGKVRYYEGVPIPMHLLIVVLLGVASATGNVGSRVTSVVQSV
jgi:CDP-diacylglycerol--serine O-phosphatidyltransferase